MKIALFALIVGCLPLSESFQQPRHLQYGHRTHLGRFVPTTPEISWALELQQPQYRLPSRVRFSSEDLLEPEANEFENENENDYGYEWTPKTMKLAIPALIGMLADPLLSLMDTVYVGRVGPIELASLGACTSIFHLAFNAFRATTAATTSLVGNASTDEEKREIIDTSLSLGVFLGVIVMGTLQYAGPWCLSTMGISRKSALFKPGIAYLGTRLFSAPAVLTIVVSEGAFRGYGNTRIPLIASMVASLINLVLDPILMFPLGLGVKGAAAATALAQFGAAATYLYFLKSREMLPKKSKSSIINKADIVKTILGANLAMIFKQGSLLLAWAYATARATR